MDLFNKCNFKYLLENKDYHWLNNDTIEDCQKCDKPFSILNRKHHCRYCGSIFCYYCIENYTMKKIKRLNVKLCNRCRLFIDELEHNWDMVKIFSMLDLDIFDYYKLLHIKKWKIVGYYFINTFRNIQYNLDGTISICFWRFFERLNVDCFYRWCNSDFEHKI